MDESALRELMESAAAAHEPPVAAIVGGALRAGRRGRARRRLAAAAGTAAAVALVAAGIPALAGRASVPPAHTATRPAQARLPIPSWWHFVTPTVPTQTAVRHPVPVTAKAAERLLLDGLPAGTTSTVSSQAATTRDVSGNLTIAQIVATGPDGAGSVVVSMTRPGTPVQLKDGALASRVYHLAGGIRVQEGVIGLQPGTAGAQVRYVIGVIVVRPDGQQVAAMAANYVYDTHPSQALSSRPALTVEQLVTMATDPRWAWKMPASFVAGAAGVRLPSVVPQP